MAYSKEWEELTDEEVLRLSQKEPDAFEVLVSRYEDAFLRKAKAILYAKEDAEEMVQDLEPEAYERIADADNFLEDLSVRSEVLAALSKLPETAARILRLQFIEGKTQEEIAKMEGSSIPAVKTRVHRAKKLFKHAYDKQQ